MTVYKSFNIKLSYATPRRSDNADDNEEEVATTEAEEKAERARKKSTFSGVDLWLIFDPFNLILFP